MTKEEVKHVVIRMFEEYYKGITLDQDYEMPRLNKNTSTMINGFIESVKEGLTVNGIKDGLQRVDVEWINNYFAYQFDYWVWMIDKSPEGRYKYGFKTISFSWIVGKKAYDRYRKNSVNAFKMKLCRTINGAKLDVFNKFKHFSSVNIKAMKSVFVDGTDEEEETKELAYNTEEGYYLCLASTTMYNDKSKLCLSCVNRRNCKEELKEHLPAIYKLRGYEQ